ncbi:MFS transporter [Mycobacterium sherrisii]|uniref:MFS transporter n=1 Tax=Mycobacterium sherrisii TaxID=243061 RepID=UPI000A158390|nr:MFS transporter [Mycobacterium sherrisii]MCV7029888.1 MFS transporter [Mycobacterium sherrisii]ORW85039.1 hypothetical protein AWC25_23390 [Mycobacterium sherrisii]
MPRAVSTRVGLYFGLLQLVLGLAWVEYVIYLPRLAAQAGIKPGLVGWLLVVDQLIFAVCDWAAGAATDRVARVIGRVGRLVAALTAISALAFLLLPFVSRSSAPLFVALIVVWAITSAALRAPSLTLLGRYTPPGRQPWVSALFVAGGGLATASTPLLTERIAGYDPRILFAASAIAVLVVTLSIVWAERRLAHSAPRAPERTEFSPGLLVTFLAAVWLAQTGFQLHNSVNSPLLFAKFAGPGQHRGLLLVFWIGFALFTPPASLLVARFGGARATLAGSVVAAVAAATAALASNVVLLATAQFICGAAWGAVMVGAVVAALAIGRRGRAGTAAGGLFAAVALATMTRIALVTAHGDRLPAVASALPWLPAVAWLTAALLLLPVLSAGPRRAPTGGPTPRPAAGRTAPCPGGRG